MVSENVSAAEIKKAGGLVKWLASRKSANTSRWGVYKSRIEAEYASYPENMRLAGLITRWAYEPMKLNLARKTTYTPDFLVCPKTGRPEFHETKGFWRDDARVKIRIAADKFGMFDFYAVTKTGGGWEFEGFSLPNSGKNVFPDWLQASHKIR